MFVLSVRASTVKFFSFIALTIVLLIGILVFSAGAKSIAASSSDVDFEGIKTAEDRVAFIRGFGIEVDEIPMEEADFRVPELFDRVMRSYNEIQRSQGLDLERYKNKKVTRYTYNVKNYENYEGVVVVNLIVYKNTVVACDISSGEPGGFVSPLVKFGSDS